MSGSYGYPWNNCYGQRNRKHGWIKPDKGTNLGLWLRLSGWKLLGWKHGSADNHQKQYEYMLACPPPNTYSFDMWMLYLLYFYKLYFKYITFNMLYTLGFGFSIMQRLSQRVLKYPSGGDILVYLGCYNKMPKTEWLKQQKCSFFFYSSGD